MAEPTKLVPVTVGENYVVVPDEILERHKGKLKQMVLIGITNDGDAVCCSSHSRKRV